MTSNPLLLLSLKVHTPKKLSVSNLLKVNSKVMLMLPLKDLPLRPYLPLSAPLWVILKPALISVLLVVLLNKSIMFTGNLKMVLLNTLLFQLLRLLLMVSKLPLLFLLPSLVLLEDLQYQLLLLQVPFLSMILKFLSYFQLLMIPRKLLNLEVLLLTSEKLSHSNKVLILVFLDSNVLLKSKVLNLSINLTVLIKHNSLLLTPLLLSKLVKLVLNQPPQD